MVKSRRKTWVVAAGVALVLVAGTVWSLRGGSTSSGQGAGSDMLPTTDTAEISRVSFDITTLATGELEAKKQVEIRSRVEQQAVIQEILPEGTRV